MLKLIEPLMDDDLPVWQSYIYLVDGRIESSEIYGTVAELKEYIREQGRSADEVRWCDTKGRGME